MSASISEGTGSESAPPGDLVGLAAYVRSAERNWWLILASVALCAGLAALLTARMETEYRSRASLALSPAPALRQGREELDALFVIRGHLTATLAELTKSTTVLHDAASRLRISPTERDAVDVGARVVPDSAVVVVTVEGTRAGVVTDTARAIVDTATTRFEELYPVTAVTALEASTAAERVPGSPMRSAAVAGALGLVVGFFVGLLRDAHVTVRWHRQTRV